MTTIPHPSHQATLTADQARTFRAAYDAAVKRYTRMGRAALAAEERALMADQGTFRAYGGPGSKDELLSAVLDLRGYTIGKLNEAIHVSAHDVTWPDCPWCQRAPATAPNGPVCVLCLGDGGDMPPLRWDRRGPGRGRPAWDHSPGSDAMSGTCETQRQAADAVRHITGSPPAAQQDGLHRLLEDACTAAGVQLGAYDHQVLCWLAGWEPWVVAVVAGLITRAHATVLDGDDRRTFLDALEVAAECRRYRASLSCGECAEHPAELCEDHAADLDRADEYEQLGARLGEGT